MQKIAIGVVAALGIVGALVFVVLPMLQREEAPEQRVSQQAAPEPSPEAEKLERAAPAFNIGVGALDADDTQEAIARLSTATQLIPDEPAAWANLALAHLRANDFDKAAPPLDKARQLAPDNSRIVQVYALMQSLQGLQAEATEALRQAVQRDAENVRARYLLIQHLRQSGEPAALAEIEPHLADLAGRSPGNLVLTLDELQYARDTGDNDRIGRVIAQLAGVSSTWPEVSREQLTKLEQAVRSGDTAAANRSYAFLRNTVKVVPAYRAGLSVLEVPIGAIAEPIREFITLPMDSAGIAEPDTGLKFTAQAFEGPISENAGDVVAVYLADEESPRAIVLHGHRIGRPDRPDWALAHPRASESDGGGEARVVPLDLNHDFRTDFFLIGRLGLRIFVQGSSGAFSDATDASGLPAEIVSGDYAAGWAVDIEADGDLDIVIAARAGAPRVLQNNGTGTFEVGPVFEGVEAVRDFAWADFDWDGDPDAVMLDEAGQAHVFWNERVGRFVRHPAVVSATKLAALASGDSDRDNRMELVAASAEGAILRISMDQDGHSWRSLEIARAIAAEAEPRNWQAGETRLWLADLDNNGAFDLVASDGAASHVWLGDGRDVFAAPQALAVRVTSVADADADGRLDLFGVNAEARAVRLKNSGSKNYRWQSLRPRAIENPGDQRINTFGIGSEVEIRSGLLVVKQMVLGPAVHFGLGRHDSVDVARIVWPNGTTQFEFELATDTTVRALQRLKGSCPFVFTYDGSGMTFVTDFLWRSPLGLRINAQDTANISQTEDWIKIRGDQMVERDGMYDISITAELWETHFFDKVALLTVDYPSTHEFHVDERFARFAPPQAVIVTTPSTPIEQAWDQDGRDVVDLVASRDGRYVDSFPLGRFQGVAEDHWIEIALGDNVPRSPGLVLAASGWVYPTDSSINVALGQAKTVRPYGLILEVPDGAGGWRVVRDDIGIPAGKKKTILIGLDGAFEGDGPRRFRLRTNSEVYWDRIAWAVAEPDTPIEVARASAVSSELRYRGFSRMPNTSRRAPDLPLYAELSGRLQRWQDLAGYHTRFGDVRELLEETDDRYVIMNAGDEMALRFRAPPAPRAGWERGFVLIGDGWVKDGDYNTAHSKTVLPLPSHGQGAYESLTAKLPDDDVYRRFPDDWLNYHTRYVAPDRFRRGLAY